MFAGFRVQGPSLNMVIYAKIANKEPKHQKKFGDGGDDGG